MKIKDEVMKDLLRSAVPEKVNYGALHFLSNREARKDRLVPILSLAISAKS